jgi:hypothetical protein
MKSGPGFLQSALQSACLASRIRPLTVSLNFLQPIKHLSMPATDKQGTDFFFSVAAGSVSHKYLQFGSSGLYKSFL